MLLFQAATCCPKRTAQELDLGLCTLDHQQCPSSHLPLRSLVAPVDFLASHVTWLSSLHLLRRVGLSVSCAEVLPRQGRQVSTRPACHPWGPGGCEMWGCWMCGPHAKAVDDWLDSLRHCAATLHALVARAREPHESAAFWPDCVKAAREATAATLAAIPAGVGYVTGKAYLTAAVGAGHLQAFCSLRPLLQLGNQPVMVPWWEGREGSS